METRESIIELGESIKCPECGALFFRKVSISCLKRVLDITYRCKKCGFEETQEYRDKYESR